MAEFRNSYSVQNLPKAEFIAHTILIEGAQSPQFAAFFLKKHQNTRTPPSIIMDYSNHAVDEIKWFIPLKHLYVQSAYKLVTANILESSFGKGFVSKFFIIKPTTMKFFNRFTTTLFAILFIFSACQNEPLPPADIALTHIPQDAVSVTGIDLGRLMEKADFEEVREMGFYKKMTAEASEKSPAFGLALKEPSTSGVDMKGKIYMTTTGQSEKIEEMTSHIFVPLSDVSSFEKILDENGLEYTTENGRKVSRPNESVQATWTNDLLIFSFSGNDVDLNGTVNGLFEMEEDNSLMKNRDFRKGMSAEHDMVTFLSTNSFANNPQAKVAIEFANLDKDILEDNFIVGYGNFENGRMEGHADFLVNSSFGRGLVGRFFKKEVTTDFSKVVPDGELAFVTTMALDLRGIDQWLSERPQSRKQVDLVVSDFGGLSRADMIKTLNGDVFLGGFNAEFNDRENFIAAFGVKSKKAGKAFLDQAVEQKNLKEIEPGFYKVLGFGGKEFSIRINKGIAHLLVVDDVFVIAKDKEVLEEIRAGKTNQYALDGFKNEAIGGWVKLQNEGKPGDPSEMFKSMQFSANSKGADFLMHTGDATTNSLKSFMQMLDSEYSEKVERSKTLEEADAIEL